MVVLSAMVVDRVRDLQHGLLHDVATHRALVFLGGISYGVYVWHYLAPELIRIGEQQTGLNFHLPYYFGWKRLLHVGTVTVMMATLSWYAFERPINALKRFYPYVRRGAAASV